MLLSYLSLVLTTLVGSILPVILDGVERKLKARIQSRIGPPITQTLYDLLKLTVKESKPLHTASFIYFSVTSVVLTMMLSLVHAHIYALDGDVLIFTLSISLLAVSLTMFTLIPLLIPNPFAYTGGIRELLLSLVNESAYLISLAVTVVTLSIIRSGEHSYIVLLSLALSLVVLFISSYALTGRVPFDIAEAEPELASGILVEFSGKVLAVMLFSTLIKRYLVKFILVASLLVNAIGWGIHSLLTSILSTTLLWIIYAIISAILGRSRVDIAPLTLGKLYIVLLGLSITGLLVGLYV
ncbi:MAG: NADH-quinone oxidoreductase subunit H [Desulfurococcaceae archaeon]|jgi:formate hydrogenlyase subunit 4|nr:NADH-quinone oxidoreductase subunit H [Desulfurococcaceae archaeon]